MAFPTGYTKYQEITIDSTKVTADITDFVIYIDLADLDKAGSDIFDTCRTDGGDIRITKSDGTTELAREVVAIDTTAKTGEIHVKFAGTLSSSADTTIRIWYNGTDTEPAVTATYGRNNVWTDYDVVYHFEEGNVNGSYENATGGTDGTGSNLNTGLTPESKVGSGGVEFEGSPDEIDTGVTGQTGAGARTMMSWFKDDTSSSGYLIGHGTAATSAEFSITWGGAGQPYIDRYGGAMAALTTDIGDDAWHFMAGRYSGTVTYLRLDGSTETASTTFAINSSSANVFIGRRDSNAGTPTMQGDIDEARYASSDLGADYTDTTYENQNSPSTFYSTSDEQGGGLAPIAMSTQVIASSVVSPTVTAIQNVSVSIGTQSIASSVPASTVSTTSTVTFVPSTQVISVSAISPVVDAGGNITIAIGTQTVSVVAVSPTVAVEATITVSIGTQSIVSSAISPTVTADENTVLVMNTQTMTISTVPRTLQGSIWGKVGWEDTVDDWTEVARTT